MSLNLALGGLNVGYNIYSGERQRQDYLKQQRWQNEFAMRQQDHAENIAHNAVSIRRKDMEAAGLHPTLAVGGAAATTQGHMPSNNAPPRPDNQMSVYEQALMSATVADKQAQIERTRADAARIRTETNLAIKEFSDIKIPTLGLQRERVTIEGRQMTLNELNSISQRAANYANIDNVKVQTAINELELEHIRNHNTKLPYREVRAAEIESIVTRTFTQLGVQASQISKFLEYMSRYIDPSPKTTPEMDRRIHQRIKEGDYINKDRR